jgi:mRNA interferase MazF
MVINRGEIWWADLPEPAGSSPGYRRPVVVIQSDIFNKTNLNTSIVALVTTNLELEKIRGNVLLNKQQSGLPKNSIVNVTQVFTLDKSLLFEFVGTLSERKMEQIDEGLRLVLNL